MRTIFIFLTVFVIASANRDHQKSSEQRTSHPFHDDVIYPNFSLEHDQLWLDKDTNEDSDEYQSGSYEYEDPDGDIYIDSGEDAKKLENQPLHGFMGYRGHYGQGPYVYWTYGKPLMNTDSGENSGENSDEDYDTDFVPYKYRDIRRFPEDDFVDYYGKRRPIVYGKNGKLMKTDSGENSDDNSNENSDKDNNRGVDPNKNIRNVPKHGVMGHHGHRVPYVIERRFNANSDEDSSEHFNKDNDKDDDAYKYMKNLPKQGFIDYHGQRIPYVLGKHRIHLIINSNEDK